MAAADLAVFEEDTVCIVNDEFGYKCGLVVENAEYLSSDEEDEESPLFERVKKGTVLVAWHPDGEEEVVPEQNVSESWLKAEYRYLPGNASGIAGMTAR